MNILIFCNEWNKTFVKKNIGVLQDTLREINYNYVYFARNVNDVISYNKLYPESKIFTDDNFPENKSKNILYYLRLYLMLKREKINLVFWSYLGYSENLVFYIARIPYVLKSDSYEPVSKYSLRIDKLFLYWIKSFVDRQASVILAETDSNMSELKKNKYRKIVLLSNSLPVDRVLNCKNDNKKEKCILVSGRFCEDKDLFFSLAVLKKLIKKDAQYKLHFLGEVTDDKYYRDFIEELKRQDIIDNFENLGYKKDEDLWKTISEYRIMLNTSRIEGLPNRFLEAMALDVVIVSKNVGKVRDYLGDSVYGVVINSEQASDYANAIHDILIDKRRLDFYVRNLKSYEYYKHDEEIFKENVKKIISSFN